MPRTKFGLCAAPLSARSCRDVGRRRVGWGGVGWGPLPALHHHCPRQGAQRAAPGPTPPSPPHHPHPLLQALLPLGRRRLCFSPGSSGPPSPCFTKIERTHVPISHLLEGSWGVCADSHKAEL